MDYHSDRFEDYSLMIYKGNKLVALLPANIKDNSVYSHQGLSYGGVVLISDIKMKDSLEIFKVLLLYLHEQNFKQFYLKPIPSFYTTQLSEETKYFMFLLNAKLIRRDTLSVIDYKNGFTISKNRKEGVRRSNRHNLKIKEVIDFKDFWNLILIPNLNSKHRINPVHSLKEITQLKAFFPNNIRQFNVYKNKEIVAGATIFETKKVAHTQYISGNSERNLLGSLDFLHSHLIENVFSKKAYFDFGNSNLNSGLKINEGLLYWKEGFGARTITQDFYVIDTKMFTELNNVFQ